MKNSSFHGLKVILFIIGIFLITSFDLKAQTDIMQECDVNEFGCSTAQHEIMYNFDGGGLDTVVVIQNISGYFEIDGSVTNPNIQYLFCSAFDGFPCSSEPQINGEFQIRFKYNGSYIPVNKINFRIYDAATTTIDVFAYQGIIENQSEGTGYTDYREYIFESTTTPFDYIKIVSTYNSSFSTFALDELHIPTDAPPNNPPTDITLNPTSVDENLADTEVGTLSTTDPDSGDSHSYSLAAGTGDDNNDEFTIVGNSLKTKSGLDYEIPVSHTRSVLIRTTDLQGAFFEKTFTITVNDVAENSPPTAVMISNLQISENNPCGATIGMLNTEDTDPGDTFTYSLVSGTGDTDNSFFTISGNNLNAAAIFNYEAKNIYNFRIRSTDGAGNFIEATFAVTIIDEDPEGTPEVICLFDLSGSMNTDFSYHVPADPEKVKLAQTKSSFNGFVNALYSLLPENVNVGLARFPGYPQTGCDAANLNPLVTLDNASKTILESTVSSLAASGSTPMLAGIDMARAMFGTGSRKVILLLSDGIHNCPSSVSSSVINAYAELLRSEGISLYTIGFGEPYFIPNDILDALASGTCGINYDITAPKSNYEPGSADPWDPETALQATFASIIVNGLGLSSTIDPLDIINQGTSKQIIIPVTDLDDKVCFYISWVKKQENYIGVKLTTPGGTELPLSIPGVTYTNGPNFKIITLSQEVLEQSGMTGNWHLEIDGSEISEPAEHFQYTVINTSQRLKLNSWTENKKFYTGNTIKIFMELLYQGNRVTGIDKISTGGTGPGISPGNWLTGKPVTPLQMKQAKQKIADEQVKWMMKDPFVRNLPRESGERYIEIQKRKFIDGLDPVTVRSWIMRNEFMLKYPSRIIIDSLLFNDDGRNGDENAGDGIYTASYTPLKEGTYNFNISAVESRDGRNIQRETQVKVYVHTRIRMKKFIKSIKLTDEIIAGKRIIDVILDLRDSNGNVPLPSALDELMISVSNGKITGRIIDNMDGTFTQKIAVGESIKPKNVIMKLRAGNDSGEQKLASGKLWIYGLIMAVLAALGIRLAARRRKK